MCVFGSVALPKKVSMTYAVLWPAPTVNGSEQHLLATGDASRGRLLDGRLHLPQAGAGSERGQDRIPDRNCLAARDAATGKG